MSRRALQPRSHFEAGRAGLTIDEDFVFHGRGPARKLRILATRAGGRKRAGPWADQVSRRQVCFDETPRHNEETEGQYQRFDDVDDDQIDDLLDGRLRRRGASRVSRLSMSSACFWSSMNLFRRSSTESVDVLGAGAASVVDSILVRVCDRKSTDASSRCVRKCSFTNPVPSVATTMAKRTNSNVAVSRSTRRPRRRGAFASATTVRPCQARPPPTTRRSPRSSRTSRRA